MSGDITEKNRERHTERDQEEKDIHRAVIVEDITERHTEKQGERDTHTDRQADSHTDT